MKTSKNYKRIDSILNAEWNKASEAGDQARLSELRDAFERNELGLDAPVYVRGLTETQVYNLTNCLVEALDIVAEGASWILFENVEAAETRADNLDEDSLTFFALGNCGKDLSSAQEEFIARSVRKSIATTKARVEKAVIAANEGHAAGCGWNRSPDECCDCGLYATTA